MNVIYYFSGTGNNLAISKEIAKELGDTLVRPISELYYNPTIDSTYQIIGFAVPIYYGHVPIYVLHTLEKVQLNKNQRVFIITAHAGATGFTLSELRQLFLNIHNKEIQEFRVRVPGNNILEYTAFPKFIQNLLFKKSSKLIKKYTLDIKQNSKTKPINPNLFDKVFDHYSLNQIAKFAEKGNAFYTNSNCNLCRTCLQVCPVHNISICNSTVSFQNNCQQCMACIQWCPNKAIEHPSRKKIGTRYHHPEISLAELIKYNHTSDEIS